MHTIAKPVQVGTDNEIISEGENDKNQCGCLSNQGLYINYVTFQQCGGVHKLRHNMTGGGKGTIYVQRGDGGSKAKKKG